MTDSPASAATGAGRGSRRPAWLPEVVVAGVLLVVVLGPVLFNRGLVLVGDMVFVPEQPWKDTWTGGDGGVPRAVPGDAVVAVLSQWVGGELLQRCALGSVVVLGFLGMTRLLAPLPLLGRLAGGLAFVWNPYMYERFAIGHWALLIGVALLPWLAGAVVRLRAVDLDPRRRARAWAVVWATLLVAGWMSPTGGVMAVLTALVLALPRVGVCVRVLVVGLAVNLPWIVPAFANGADQLAPDPFGVAAFASRADTPWGVVGSVISFGGIWKESIFPEARGELLLSGVGLVVALLGVLGLFLGRARVMPSGPALGIGVLALALALGGAWDVTRPVVQWMVEQVPGGGLLRDGQKWVAPWLLVCAVGFGQFVGAAARWTSARGALTAAVPLVLLPALALPSFAWGVGGMLAAHPFPDDWYTVREEMERLEVGDDPVVVLSFATYRRFDWTPRTTLDPSPRFFPGTMVTEDALTVPSGTVGGESALAARVRDAGSPDELAEVLSQGGVRWGLVHRDVDPPALPTGAEVVLDTRQLDLVRLAEPVAEPTWEPGWRRVGYVVLDLGVLGASTIVMICLLCVRNPSQLRATDAYTRKSQREVWED